jgi:membrane-bound lytic murein transglycosylase D
MAVIRRTPHALVAVTVLLAGACAHAPPRPLPPSGESPSLAATSDAGTAPLPGATAAGTPAATAGQEEATPAAESAHAPEPTQVAGLTPAQYADLFDRMRAGFKLEDGRDHHAVDQQLQWYVANPDYLQRAFSRADLYLYQIVTELERRGMPLELALLPVVESAFEPYAYSRARASGLWQFIPDTGSKYGLKQDWWYDGRRDIMESTRAALDYLQSLHDEFGGDWLLAIAAYNCGEAMVERAVEMNRAAGRSVDFWDLWLPLETRAYVPKLLAMKRLVLDPEAYGLAISPIPNQPYFVRVPTDGQINLKLAAEIAGITPEELYELNPAFHRWATDPSGPHFLLLPVDAADVFADNITQLTPDQRLGVERYVVKRGDSIASVARQFHTTVNVVRELNDMPTGGLEVDDVLRVPSAVTELPAKVMLAAARVDGRGRSLRPHVQIVRRGESLWTIARRNGMNVSTLAMMNGLQPGDALHAGQRIRTLSSASGGHVARRRMLYTVREGDTVSEIARLFQCSVPQLLAWNGLSTHSHLHAGQKLRIHLTTRHS